MSVRMRSAMSGTSLSRAERGVWPGISPGPGMGVPRVMAGVFDPGSNTALRPIGTYGLGVSIPAGAIVRKVWYEVLTTVTTAGTDAGTIALILRSVPVTVLQAATAVAACGNVWDKGLHEVTVPLVKTATTVELGVTVAAQALTAGKLVVFVEYLLSIDEAAVAAAPAATGKRVVIKGTFNPTATAGERTIAAHGLGVFVPAGAIVVTCMVDVRVTCASAGADAGTIAIHIEAANDLVTAIAISNGGNPWDAGLHPATVTGIKATVDRELTATVAEQALTAGTVDVYVEYLL